MVKLGKDELLRVTQISLGLGELIYNCTTSYIDSKQICRVDHHHMDALNKHTHTNIQNFIVCSMEIFLSHNLSLQTNSSPDELAMFRGKDKEFFPFLSFFFFYTDQLNKIKNTSKSELLGAAELEAPKSWKDLNFIRGV